MSTQNPPTQTQPTARLEWPTLDLEHDPQPLEENERIETEQSSLDAFGVPNPREPTPTPTFPVDDRPTTEQAPIFQFPRPWIDDADRLEHYFDERELSISDLSDLLGTYRSFETVRDRLKHYGIRVPDDHRTLAQRLESMEPGDVGDDLPAAFRGGAA
ncbi:hypothetical protein [Natronorubrum daqingense]|uniref:Uncharacterized protein n=1 Tax=Natronorubrum daqingense TaxID=588898 RepID=A0A1N7G4Y3_9EURY|nr:hypothetical protein [Natronorubrum daqingense]APX98727.1 hypothetical protein BB347_18655 [Natronorubrum daqingense]SIS07631.1 hypothetical protein SAMN05421809_3727 [Natronorubrum daqingense]